MKHGTMLQNAKNYIDYRRRLGYVFSDDDVLIDFAKFADAYEPGQPLTIKLALQWATLPKSKKNYHARRLSMLRSFSKYLVVRDSRTQLIPSNILGPNSYRISPYIYSQNEIVKLVETEVYAKFNSFSNSVFSTVIGLLACTGMRIGEALSLKRENIDWNRRTIIVRWSKRLPMRLIPIAPSTISKLKKYEQERDSYFQGTKSDHFFLTSKGCALTYRAIYPKWKRLLELTGVGSQGPQIPRIHDLRHTFACNHLLRAYKKKTNIDVAVHSLSVYLGHSTIREVYWYLTGIPSLLQLCGEQFENDMINYRTGTSQ